ncbi:MAG: UDP-N-acetylmuramate dehydrogenase [Lachnospiraceae bacterium]|nr:UDP-N-acetylmuramate dehydrogenase [Lachnospiraceae bacterium]
MLHHAEVRRRFEEAAGKNAVFENEEMSARTSFRIGGAAALFVTPDSEESAVEVIRIARESGIPYYVMGNGSNLLVADSGFDGAVIQLAKKMSGIRVEGQEIRVQCGALLSRIAAEARNAGLDGFSFASGIPGTFGGACMMNAGAYGGEMKDVLSDVRILDPDGNVRTVFPEEMGLGYRTSAFEKRGDIVLSGTIRLKEGDPEKIGKRMEELAQLRKEKQPLTQPSAGSTFKRPKGYFAGKLISDAGLKGYSIGGAQVSEKHAGFVINTGGATAEDVRNLIAFIRQTVFEKFGVELETEVKFLGFEEM